MHTRRRTALIAAFACVSLAPAFAARPTRDVTLDEGDNRRSAIDYGQQPSVQTHLFRAHALSAAIPGAVPQGGTAAATLGAFGPTVPWPIVPIHEVLLPDGRVMSYGTGPSGVQGGGLIYDVWTPSLGTDAPSHLVLPNTTATDIFCSGQSMMWATGETLITGGNSSGAGFHNVSINNTTIFSPASNTIRASAAMQYPRWYDSVVPLPGGEMLVLGGRINPTTSATTPEVYDAVTGWRTLTGAMSAKAFANSTYPRGFVAPDGRVFVLAIDGRQYDMTTDGAGTIVPAGTQIPAGDPALPSVMFAPGKILSVRQNAVTGVVDINGPVPVWTQAGNIDQSRIWSSGTVMADGKVLVTGGSIVANQLVGAAYQTETWDPATGLWTAGAAAVHARLYHSNALLLPDGSVLTGGGGSPGPVRNLNSEIYYPPYLFLNDGSGNAAPRPTLAIAPTALASADLAAGLPMTLVVGDTDVIGRVTFVRAGSASHGSNLEQRFIDLPFTQTGPALTVQMPANPNVLLPGYWMAFVWQNGTPSLAQMVLVMS